MLQKSTVVQGKKKKKKSTVRNGLNNELIIKLVFSVFSVDGKDVCYVPRF